MRGRNHHNLIVLFERNDFTDKNKRVAITQLKRFTLKLRKILTSINKIDSLIKTCIFGLITY